MSSCCSAPSGLVPVLLELSDQARWAIPPWNDRPVSEQSLVQHLWGKTAFHELKVAASSSRTTSSGAGRGRPHIAYRRVSVSSGRSRSSAISPEVLPGGGGGGMKDLV